jgi:Cysteine rich repeat
MKRRFHWLRLLVWAGVLPFIVVLAVVAGPRAANAQAALAVDCANDLRAFCSNVSPGNDRLVACLISYEDKINPRCRLTAYLASGKLSQRARGLRGLAKICSSDIRQYCSNLAFGGGRIADCLKKNRATLTDECRKVVK